MNDLTVHQKEKFNEIQNFIRRGEKRILLKGSAGVGKTWLVYTIVKHLATITKPKRILCSAPTHKALSIIRSKVKVKEVKFTTVHSTLQYKSATDPITGERIFISKPNTKWPPLNHVDYWIIDEASMVDTQMIKFIEEYALKQNTIVIFVGDEKQINPVGEMDSPAFHQGYPEVELTEIIRQGEGNPIIFLSRNISKIWDKEPDLLVGPEDKDVGTGYIYTQNQAKIIEELARVNGTDEFKYLAWTNKEVDTMNYLVRRRIYGDYPGQIELNETIVFDAPHGDYNTNEALLVQDLVKETISLVLTLKDTTEQKMYETVDFVIYTVNGDIQILADESLPKFRKYNAIMNKNCNDRTLSFEKRNDFKDRFAKIKYNHALTVHKSQGSTYKTVVVNIKDIGFNPSEKEKEKLFYTGITRASNLLILYNV